MTNLDRLTEHGCGGENADKVCRSRGGESCAFDGAMIVLQPIADTAHLVHGPIACCGNSWEGRGTRSTRGTLHRMGFTTDMGELDIVYGAEAKLQNAIRQLFALHRPSAIFVYATCVSGLIGEDIEASCRTAGKELGIPVIPVNAPGFVGPKNLGNRIAGEVLLDHVIGTREPAAVTDHDINLIGEYNVAGDLWLVEPVLRKAGFRLLSRITGDAAFDEITWAHRARVNAVVCSRALINVARGMQKRYGIPYAEVSFFGKTEMSKALRAIAETGRLHGAWDMQTCDRTEEVIAIEEQKLAARLEPYAHLRGKRAVLYTGGVKSWSFISALLDLGIEIVAVGTKKSTLEDEEKMKAILGRDAPLVEDVTPKNLLRLLRDRKADILIAGGRNQYLAVKEGYPFVDVNQERHHAYAGYEGLVNFAEQIGNSLRFYAAERKGLRRSGDRATRKRADARKADSLLIDPLRHSPAIGAALAVQGIHRAVPVIHGAQGCNFLGKVLLTRHFREPIAMVSSKLFAEDVIMGSEERLIRTADGLVDTSSPDVIALISTGLTEIKGDDMPSTAHILRGKHPGTTFVTISTPDHAGGLEHGYAAATAALLPAAGASGEPDRLLLNILAGPHLTPADSAEVKEIIASFGLRAIVMPDLSALDGSRQGISALAEGGLTATDIRGMGRAAFTFAVGACMEGPAKILQDRFGIDFCVLESLAGLRDSDTFLKMLSVISGREIPAVFERQRRILVDTFRDAHFLTAGKSVCIALDESHALQTARVATETGAAVGLVVLSTESAVSGAIDADRVVCGGLSSVEGGHDLLMANSHAYETARRLGMPLYETGFPVFRTIGYPQRVTIGYRGTIAMVQDLANLLAQEVHR